MVNTNCSLIKYSTSHFIRKGILIVIASLLISIVILHALNIEYHFLRIPLLILLGAFVILSLVTSQFTEIGSVSIDDRVITVTKSRSEDKYNLSRECSARFYYGGYKGIISLAGIFINGYGFTEGDLNFIVITNETETIVLQLFLKEKGEYELLKNKILFIQSSGLEFPIRRDFSGRRAHRHIRQLRRQIQNLG